MKFKYFNSWCILHTILHTKIKVNNEVLELDTSMCGIGSKDKNVGGSVESVTINENRIKFYKNNSAQRTYKSAVRWPQHSAERTYNKQKQQIHR